MIAFRCAGTADISTISKLAHAIWPEAYGSILSQAQLDYMLELIYSDAALVDQIINKGHAFHLCIDGDRAIGFASVSPKNPGDPNVYRLHKFYLLPASQGKGIGKRFLQYIIGVIREKGAQALELNVNRNNKAIHFYSSQGFQVTREEDIDIGKGYFMNDYVMQLDLPGKT